MHCLFKKAAIKAERYKWCDKQKLGIFNMSLLGACYGMICKTGILLVIETTLEFHSAAWFSSSLVLASFVRQLYSRLRPSEEWSPESKIKVRNRQPLVRFKPCFGRAVMVPLPLSPWYFQSVIMYAQYWFRNFARAGVGAALQRLIET